MKNRRKQQQFTVETAPQPTQEIPNTMTEKTEKSTLSDSAVTKISSEDLAQIQLKYKDFQLATLQQKLAVQELEKAVENARSELVKLNDAVNLKYGLNPAKDKINLQDGAITRG